MSRVRCRNNSRPCPESRHALPRGATTPQPTPLAIPSIQVTNRQIALRVHSGRIARLAHAFMHHVSRMAPMIRWRSLSIVIADDQKMALLNRRYLRRAGPTDVMSFVYRSGKHPEARYDAEVILNAERAASAGLCYGGISRELALYLAHGCDHLSGNSDDTRRDRSRMRRRELRWLKVATESGLMEGLTQS